MNPIKLFPRLANAPVPVRLSSTRPFTSSSRYLSSEKLESPAQDDQQLATKAQEIAKEAEIKHKTVAEADAELMEKLAGHSDEGGAAGVEYEDGKPVAQKRSVKNNMFRLI
ncbi:hypothetical protein CBER1_06248 [Cercospora berteroae]|uniref:Uncharacterized protein n=1 Tax=Cercospora berteroae TaxID=357750 RepID=A0A2S6CCT5_9PEZI|nr:hypothetical protein CBER1_06248 [Cercospora berteroae]